MKDNTVYSRQTLKTDETLIIDGKAGTTFKRVLLIDGQPGILITNPTLNKKIVITGPILAGINGWLAKMFSTDLHEVTIN
jgi:hypothetical protein